MATAAHTHSVPARARATTTAHIADVADAPLPSDALAVELDSAR